MTSSSNGAQSNRLINLQPQPEAEPRKHREHLHNQIIDDPWHWLRDPNYPEVNNQAILDYLNAENAYTDATLTPHRALVDELFDEIKARQVDEDESYPYRDGDFFYQWRFETGGQYRSWYRWPHDAPHDVEQFINETHLARDVAYFRLGDWQFSDDQRYLLHALDLSGAERYALKVFDRISQRWLDDAIPDCSARALWAADSRSFLYTKLNASLRPFKVMRHRIGEPIAHDDVVYEEADDGFFVGIDRTQSRDYFVIATGDHVTSEIRLLRRDNDDEPLLLVAPRRASHEYDVDHNGTAVFIRTNDRHKNFRLVRTTIADLAEASWQEVLPASEARYLKHFIAFRNRIASIVRIDGIDEVEISDLSIGETKRLTFPDPLHSAWFGTNTEVDLTQLRLGFSALTQPTTVYDYDLRTNALLTRKVQQIPSGYDASAYVSERLWAIARDGTRVPVSLVYRKDRQAASKLLHLHGYGAYGIAEQPIFSSARLSLIDRGFMYALAHTRGGDDLGYHWYEAGKGSSRRNAFNDFIDVAKALIARGYTEAGKISISGGSAGGTLMGVVLNEAPELFGAAVAHVPFVDVLNTMLDATLPLTPMEWPEWGNPIEDRAAFDLIKSYSPYENVAPQAYPPLLVTAGLHDSRVTYWEPAKWVAKLRAMKTDSNVLLLRTNMSAGHGGKSGRFEAFREVAEEYAFILLALAL